MLGGHLGILWLKKGAFLLPKLTSKSLSISGNLPITSNSKKAINMNGPDLYTSIISWACLQIISKEKKSIFQEKLMSFYIQIFDIFIEGPTSDDLGNVRNFLKKGLKIWKMSSLGPV